ncbi:zinc finger protein 318-like isoform X2 [Macaca nemestrina]|uniref:zinc finger protein 318-like isoform X2 n=1 Tax=Macaca nemestrina TaxID=9545 RepID=UPI0039B8895E
MVGAGGLTCRMGSASAWQLAVRRPTPAAAFISAVCAGRRYAANGRRASPGPRPARRAPPGPSRGREVLTSKQGHASAPHASRTPAPARFGASAGPGSHRGHLEAQPRLSFTLPFDSLSTAVFPFKIPGPID